MKHLPVFTSALGSESGEEKIRVILQQIDREDQFPPYLLLRTPLRRGFGPAGTLPSVSYEGQAAVELEMIADPEEEGAYRLFHRGGGRKRDHPSSPAHLKEFSGTWKRGSLAPAISGKFHNTLVEIGVTLCQKIRERGGPKKVALSGGVFQNRLLSETDEGRPGGSRVHGSGPPPGAVQ